MRSRPLARLASTLIGLLYLLAWGEPVALHPCPMHDGVGIAAVASVGSGHAAPAAHGAHHAPANDVARPATTPADHHADDHGDHACQCLGHGCCPAGVVAPTAQQVRWTVAVRRVAEPAPEAPATHAAIAPRLLPFANGPPAVA